MRLKKSSIALISILAAISISNADPIKLQQSYEFQKCNIDVQNNSSLDISDKYNDFPNPFEFYTNPKYPGVTLPGPDRQKHCNWTINTPTQGETRFTWNSQQEQCILNGQYGYFDPNKDTCSTDETSIMSHPDREKWYAAAINGKIVTLDNIPGAKGPQQIMIGFGHGVLNSPCGGVALVKNETPDGQIKYAAILQVGTRAWSFEISNPANTYLANDNYGGTCYIPEVFILSNSDVDSIIKQLA